MAEESPLDYLGRAGAYSGTRPINIGGRTAGPDYRQAAQTTTRSL